MDQPGVEPGPAAYKATWPEPGWPLPKKGIHAHRLYSGVHRTAPLSMLPSWPRLTSNQPRRDRFFLSLPIAQLRVEILLKRKDADQKAVSYCAAPRRKSRLYANSLRINGFRAMKEFRFDEFQEVERRIPDNAS